MYKVLGTESCSVGDIRQPATASTAANQNPPSKSLVASFSKSFISSGKQEVEQQFSGKGMTL
jgi:hypothetical protein